MPGLLTGRQSSPGRQGVLTGETVQNMGDLRCWAERPARACKTLGAGPYPRKGAGLRSQEVGAEAGVAGQAGGGTAAYMPAEASPHGFACSLLVSCP